MLSTGATCMTLQCVIPNDACNAGNGEAAMRGLYASGSARWSVPKCKRYLGALQLLLQLLLVVVRLLQLCSQLLHLAHSSLVCSLIQQR